MGLADACCLIVSRGIDASVPVIDTLGMKKEIAPIDGHKETRVSAADSPQTKAERFAPDYALLARMIIRDGKTFRESSLAVGYSESVASRGLRALMADSQPVAEAIMREEKAIDVNINRLKPLAVNRLYHELLNPASNNGMKAIELAGRFKETDWFVRNSETNLGILINMSDTVSPPEGNIIDVSKE